MFDRNETLNATEQGSRDISVAVLERKPAAAVDPAIEDEAARAKAEAIRKRRENFERIINHEKYDEVRAEIPSETAVGQTATAIATDFAPAETVEMPVTTETPAARVSEQVGDASLTNEDACPTPQTMRYGEASKKGYRLSSKGKFMIFLYTLVTAVILSLIVVNTGTLASVAKKTEAKTAELDSLQAQYTELTETIDGVSSDEYVETLAEEYGMVKAE